MATQLITIGPLGQLRSLHMKRGRGVDLRKLGKATITRTTLIEWNEDRQKWMVRFTGDNTFWTHDSVRLYTGDYIPAEVAPDDETDGDGFLLWSEYDDAVSAEIAVIQTMRLWGRDK